MFHMFVFLIYAPKLHFHFYCFYSVYVSHHIIIYIPSDACILLCLIYYIFFNFVGCNLQLLSLIGGWFIYLFSCLLLISFEFFQAYITKCFNNVFSNYIKALWVLGQDTSKTMFIHAAR